MSDLASVPRLVIFDLDGVVYRGAEPIGAAVALIGRLHDDAVPVRFATNNSTATRDEYVERLATMGVRATRDEIVTSTSATVEHLKRHRSEIRSVLAVGEDGMVDELATAGYEVTRADEAVDEGYLGAPLDRRYDAVIAGLDRRFDYRRLAAAATAVRDGSTFVATNADARYPTPRGFLPGAGSIVGAIAAAAGVAPLVIGKPEPAMFHAILEATGVAAADALVVGDNPDSDIVAARRAGIPSALVLTGVADERLASGLEGERRPDLVVRDAAELMTRLAANVP